MYYLLRLIINNDPKNHPLENESNIHQLCSTIKPKAFGSETNKKIHVFWSKNEAKRHLVWERKKSVCIENEQNERNL